MSGDDNIGQHVSLTNKSITQESKGNKLFLIFNIEMILLTHTYMH